VGTMALAAEQVGIARWCLETTVGYLQERRQFNRVLGSYQALKHRLAELFVMVDAAASAARYACSVPDPDAPETAIATATAASYCSETALRAAEEALQLHGGIAMTWEHPVHLYLKRGKADHIARGLPSHHRQRLARYVDLPM